MNILDSNFRSHTFISNDYLKGTKVLKTIQKELINCSSFDISVAFVTMSGFVVLANQLKELKEKGVKGRLITSTYNNFNDPSIFRKLMELENLEVRVHTRSPLHTKGYIFYRENATNIIIGSSNLTQSALTTNREWNLKLNESTDSILVESVKREFENLWKDSPILTQEWIDDYENIRRTMSLTQFKSSFKSEKLSSDISGQPITINEKHTLKEKLYISDSIYQNKSHEIKVKIIPNKMQREALRKLIDLRARGKNKGLIISATGTGKTYLAALDVCNFKAKRVLFIIHREQIARDALRSFSNVIEGRSFGVFSGNSKEIDKDIIFTTIQTISKKTNYELFSKTHFDYIIIDEAHRSGAESYNTILNYFEPDFLLGMTATPERTDGYNIFQLFDNNIAYEIRLKHALEEDLLTPFHYFGISEVKVDGDIIDDQSTISKLLHKDRIDYIVEQMKYYGYSGNRVKGLIFCSRNEEAQGLSHELNRRGLRTASLSGSNSQLERENMIERLEKDEGDLDYIITVDIFNEGIDIPEINQIVMLRPTQSAIIFVQQMGRGLRKTNTKEFVVVLDFIGNYKNNFMIPIALSGDRTMNKNNLREFMIEGNDTMPGCSTFEFDRVTKQAIFEAINKANLSSMNLLKNEYENLKHRINRIPYLMDYREHDVSNPQIIFENSSFKNYHEFLKKVERDYDGELNDFQSQTLSFLSLELIEGKRLEELYIIKNIIENKKIDKLVLERTFSKKTVDSALTFLKTSFLTQEERKKYNLVDIIRVEGNSIFASENLKNSLNDKSFKMLLEDVLNYSITNYNEKFKDKTDGYGFVLYNQYTRKDASWLLNWETNQQATIYGYKIDRNTNTMPVFVTYHKSNEIEESINYNDAFIDNQTFSWMSRNNRSISSEEIQRIINSKKEGLKILLNIKREDGESKYFYYLGEVEVLSYYQTTIISKGKELPIVNFIFKIKNPVKQDLYEYITAI